MSTSNELIINETAHEIDPVIEETPQEIEPEIDKPSPETSQEIDKTLTELSQEINKTPQDIENPLTEHSQEIYPEIDKPSPETSQEIDKTLTELSQEIDKTECLNKKATAIILSGGGIKGFCQLGTLQYLFDKTIISHDDLKYFFGTSVGSIIAFFISIGYNGLDIMLYLCSNQVLNKLKSTVSFNVFSKGIYDYTVIDECCKNMTLEKIGFIPTLKELFEKFNKILTVTTYNLTDRKTEYVSYLNYPDLSCLDAIRMSSNIPYIFSDFVYNDKEYIDGGIVDNFPISICNKDLYKIGIFLSTPSATSLSDFSSIHKIIDKFYRIIRAPLMELESSKLKNIDDNTLLIALENSTSPFSFSISDKEKSELFSYGYNIARKIIEKD
jgi:NTE family protein